MFQLPFKQNYPITSKYGVKRPDGSVHSGTDFMCPYGTEVIAPADGVVIKVWEDFNNYANGTPYGAGHAMTYRFSYNDSTNLDLRLYHLSERAGLNSIHKKGEVIAKTGNSGNNVTHAHITVWLTSKASGQSNQVDPLLYLSLILMPMNDNEIADLLLTCPDIKTAIDAGQFDRNPNNWFFDFGHGLATRLRVLYDSCIKKDAVIGVGQTKIEKLTKDIASQAQTIVDDNLTIQELNKIQNKNDSEIKLLESNNAAYLQEIGTKNGLISQLNDQNKALSVRIQELESSTPTDPAVTNYWKSFIEAIKKLFKGS